MEWPSKKLKEPNTWVMITFGKESSHEPPLVTKTLESGISKSEDSVTRLDHASLQTTWINVESWESEGKN